MSCVQIDIVTCVYEQELGMLALQAQSLAKFLDEKIVNKIYVIVNDMNGDLVRLKILQRIKPLYLHLAGRVEVIDASKLIDLKPNDNGWVTQQVLKLKIATLSTTDIYLLLDAKNHLTKKLSESDLFAADGKPKVFWQAIGAAWNHRRCYLSNFFDLPSPDLSEKTLPVITPYLMHRQIVLDMVAFVEEKTEKNISALFREHPHDVSEFLLYFFYLKKNHDISSLYSSGAPFGTVIWHSSLELIADRVSQALNGDSLFFAVHSKALKILSEEEFESIATLWRALGFYDDQTPAEVIREFLLQHN